MTNKGSFDYFDPNLPQDFDSSQPTGDRLVFDPTPVADMPDALAQDAPLDSYDREGLQSLIWQSIPSTPFKPTPLPTPPRTEPVTLTDAWTLPQMDWSFLNGYLLANQAPALTPPSVDPASFAAPAQPSMPSIPVGFQPPQAFTPLAPFGAAQQGWGREPSSGFGAPGGTDSFDGAPRGNLFRPAPAPAGLTASHQIEDGMTFRRPLNATPSTPASFNLFPVPVAPPTPERELSTSEKMFGRRDPAPPPVDWAGALGGPWASRPDTAPAASFPGAAPTSYADEDLYEELFAPVPSPRPVGVPGPAPAGSASAGWGTAAAISPSTPPSFNFSPVGMPVQKPVLLADPNLYAPVLTPASMQPAMAPPASDANLGGQYWNTVRPRLLVGPNGTEVVPSQIQTTVHGTPFESRGDALHVLKRRGLNPDAYHIQPVYGGHVAIPRTEMPLQAPVQLSQNRSSLSVNGAPTGRKFEPTPKWPESKERYILLIQKEFEGSIVPIRYALSIVARESNFNPKDRAYDGKGGVTSTAKGLFQGTNKAYITYGGDAYSEAGQIRFGRIKLEEAWHAARKALGRDPTPGELYIVHYMGVAGGPAIMKADPNASWVETLNKWGRSNNHGNWGDTVLKANQNLKNIETNRDLLKWMSDEVEKYMDKFEYLIRK